MKIGFDAKRFFHNSTGLGNYSRDLIRILSVYYPENQYYLYNPKFRKNNYDIYNSTVRFPRKKIYKKLNSLWRSFGVKQELVNDNIDIYHGLSGEIPFNLSKKIKKIVTIHDLIFMRYPELYSFWDRKIHFYKFKYAAKNSDTIIAISEQTKQDIIHYFGICESKIKVVYQGCADEFKKTYSEKEKIEVSCKYNLPNEFLLNVGTIEKRKNLLTIVKAIKDLDVKLVVIGKKTKYYTEVLNYINDNKINDKIIFLEKVSLKDLAVIYQLATVFIYPSIFEGFGIPIIEALFSKTPVITSKNDVFREAGGENSIYIDPQNSNELKNIIIFLLKDKHFRESISEKGYLFAQNFSDEKIANDIMKIYLS